MKIIRTIVWVILAIALLIFTINNWNPVEVKIWEGLVLETKVPALVILAFLLGLLPMWALHKGARWRMGRRISALETSLRSTASAAAPPPPPAPEALQPDTTGNV